MNTAVVVVSCKKYEQTWIPFFTLYKKYWPDNPFKTYLLTDQGSFDGVETINTNNDYGFSSNLIIGLKNIKEDSVIYFQDDYLPVSPFDTNKIKYFVDISNRFNLSCIRLAPCPGPTANWAECKELGIIQKGDEYRISTQTAIWNKNFILSMLVPGESGADFEILGTKRSNFRTELILSVWRGETPVPYFMTAISRGRWMDGAWELLQKEGLLTDKITRIIK